MSKHRTSILSRTTASAAAAATLCALPSMAMADPNPYTLGALETIAHDSNVFRGQEGTPVYSDWSSITGLTGSINQPIGREVFKADAEVDLIRYKNNSQLNSVAHSVDLEGDWSTVGDLSGEVGLSNSAQLYTYNLYSADQASVLRERNVQTVNSGFARFHLGVVTRWTVDAVFNGYDRKYSSAVYEPYNVRRWDGTLGTTYQFSSALKGSISGRYTKGDYPDYTGGADHFDRDDLILGVVYVPSGASTLTANVSKGRENHSVLTMRSSRTWAADARWIWQISGRSQLNVDFVKDDDTGSTETAFIVGQIANNDARKRTAITSALNYEVTSKISAKVTAAYAKRDLDSAYALIPSLNQRGSDHLYDAGLSLIYAPTRNTKLNCGVSYEKRTTQGGTLSTTYPYTDTTISCGGQIAFN